MARQRQHFIPRFLQKGFSSRVDGDKVLTWLFWKNNDPKEASTRDVGLERGFSSSGQNSAADAQITEEEPEFSNLVCDLKNGLEPPLSDPLLPQLIARFEMRTRHFRERYFLQSNMATTHHKDLILSDRNKFKEINERHWPEYLLWLQKNELAHWKWLQQFDPKEQMEIELKIIDDLISQSPESVEKACSENDTQMKPLIKSKHLKMLEQPVSENPRTACFEKLTYAILQARRPLILGDSIVLFSVDGHPYKPFFGEEDVLNAVYLPLTPDKVLVGVQPGFDAISADIQEAIARCSLEFFIGAENSKENRRLQREIGVDAIRFAKMEMKAALDRM